MARNYGSVGSGRRSSSAVWQWMIIGMVFGFGCAVIAFFGLLLLGFVGIDPTGGGLVGQTPTPLVMVVTATQDPNVPTVTPIIVTATQQELPTQESQIILPSPTSAVSPTAASTDETIASTQEVSAGGTSTGETGAGGTGTNNTIAPTDLPVGGDPASLAGGIPSVLEAAASPLVPVEGGTFLMGTTQEEVAASVRFCVDNGGQCTPGDAEDSYPQHEVTLPNFQIERTEVTLGQYVTFLNYLKTTGRDHRNGCNFGGLAQQCIVTRLEDPTVSNIAYDTNIYTVEPTFLENNPIVNVSWFGANAYCQALGRRLPTEAEWERAARGTSNYLYPWANPDDPNNLDITLANTDRPGEDIFTPIEVTNTTTDVSQFNVLHMAGNVSEWVSDWYSPSTYTQNFQAGNVQNPTGPERGTERVVRGGNFAYNFFFARAVHRLSRPPAQDFANVGFRCAADTEVTATTLNDQGSTSGTGSTQPGFTPPAGTPDPSALGIIESQTEESSAPTLPPAVTGTAIPPLPPGD